jgi:hypothetical protein
VLYYQPVTKELERRVTKMKGAGLWFDGEQIPDDRIEQIFQ